MFLARAYSWIQAPSMALVLAGVLIPYIKPYYDISMTYAVILMFPALILIGWMDRKLGFFKAELDRHTKYSGILLEKLDGIKEQLNKMEMKDAIS